MALTEGSQFPSGTKWVYVPYEAKDKDVTACGIPQPLDLDKELKGKKVVIVAVPGAFTPTCTANHIPPFGEKFEELKKKGVDEVIVTSTNDPFVLSAWGKALGLADKFKFASEPNGEFPKENGVSLDLTSKGLGVRSQRYAAIVDDGKIVYFGEDSGPVEKSGVDAVLAKL